MGLFSSNCFYWFRGNLSLKYMKWIIGLFQKGFWDNINIVWAVHTLLSFTHCKKMNNVWSVLTILLWDYFPISFISFRDCLFSVLSTPFCFKTIFLYVNSRLARFRCFFKIIFTGHAFGAGAIIALVHDYRVMRNDRGWFSLNEVRMKIQVKPETIRLIR